MKHLQLPYNFLTTSTKGSKFRLILLFGLVVNLFGLIKSDTSGQDATNTPHLINCYQDIPINAGQEINLLRTGFTQFKFVGTSSPRYLQITGYLEDGSLWGPDGTGELWGYYGLTDNLFSDYYLTVLNGDNEGNQIRVVELYTFEEGSGGIIKNPNYFNFPEFVSYMDLVLFNPNQSGNYLPGDTIRVNLLSNEEAINIEPVTDENECVTYTNFKTSIDMNLSYFCGNITYSINIKPEDSHSYPVNETGEFTPGGNQNENIPFDDYCLSDCGNVTADPGSGPIPCGCRLFDLETTILPCDDKITDPNCPPIEFSKEIRICCSCDITFYPDN